MRLNLLDWYIIMRNLFKFAKNKAMITNINNNLELLV